MLNWPLRILFVVSMLACSRAEHESAYSFAVAEPVRQRSDFWESNYEVLRPDFDPHVRRAHQIFERVCNAAGSRPGVSPRLMVIATDPFGTPRAEALPDGGIVVSKGVLDICYADERYADDRLAFVLAHEIAHQLKDDFWHYQFFGALDAEESRRSTNKTALEQVREIAKETDKVRSKELQADEHAVVYMTMAGFNPRAIVANEGQINFFEFWAAALDPARLVDAPPDHPAPEVRAAAVIARLNQVLEQTDYFQLGVLLYLAGEYCEAGDAFATFLKYFPSREVYHNLAACHHQLGLKQDPDRLPFKLSFPIDSHTLADQPRAGGTRHIDHAIAFYKQAIDLDPDYPLPYIALGCAYMEAGDTYKGVGVLQDALRMVPDSPLVNNNLGVAFRLVGNIEDSHKRLLEARRSDPTYDAPVFNLGVAAIQEGNPGQVQEYFTEYLALDGSSAWAELARSHLELPEPSDSIQTTALEPGESIAGLHPGAKLSEVPAEWGEPVYVRELTMIGSVCGALERSYAISVFRGGVLLVAKRRSSGDPTIAIIDVLPESKLANERGVRVGSQRHDVLENYGAPLRLVYTPQGEYWVYDDDRRSIVFSIADGVVASWAIY